MSIAGLAIDGLWRGPPPPRRPPNNLCGTEERLSMAGQYITPPDCPEIYPPPPGPIMVRDITLHSFTMTFPPPPPGMSSIYPFGALADLFVSWDGGQTFMPFTLKTAVEGGDFV